MPNWDKRQVAPGVKMQWGPLSAPYLFGMLQLQNTVMGESERFSSEWLKRQQDFARLALNTGAELSIRGMTDPARALELGTALQQAAAQRLNDDMRDYIDMMTHCMNCVRPYLSAQPDETAPASPAPARIAAAA